MDPTPAIERTVNRVVKAVLGTRVARKGVRKVMAAISEMEVQLSMLGLPDKVDVTQTPEGRKMLSGEWYRFGDPILNDARARAQFLYGLYNRTGDGQQSVRRWILGELLGGIGEGAGIRPPFYCDYGFNIVLGAGTDINFGCVVLDCGKVHIGERVLIAPGVHIYTVGHSLDPVHRARGLERTKPVIIGDDVWIAGGVIILPGVTIGEGSFIGPGSMVRENVPSYVYAEGNPCRVVRKLIRSNSSWL